ncbi:MAG: hypothetical protein ACYYK0_01050 [Candidatus Eutrophobiaceae bacterium]
MPLPIAAVAHDDYLKPLDEILSLLRPGGVSVDVKGAWDGQNAIRAAGYALAPSCQAPRHLITREAIRPKGTLENSVTRTELNHRKQYSLSHYCLSLKRTDKGAQLQCSRNP